MSNLMNKKVTLGSAECAQMAGNASAFGYQCNRAMSQASTANLVGSTVRFEHSSTFVVDICEVVIYANPSMSKSICTNDTFCFGFLQIYFQPDFEQLWPTVASQRYRPLER